MGRDDIHRALDTEQMAAYGEGLADCESLLAPTTYPLPPTSDLYKKIDLFVVFCSDETLDKVVRGEKEDLHLLLLSKTLDKAEGKPVLAMASGEGVGVIVGADSSQDRILPHCRLHGLCGTPTDEYRTWRGVLRIHAEIGINAETQLC